MIRRHHPGSRANRWPAKPEINITPFVDVMLVLLLVFMITAPLMTVGVLVDLPKSRAKPIATITEPVVISLRQDGEIFLADRQISGLEELVAALQAIEEERDDLTVYLRAASGLEYGRVMELMGILSDRGLNKLTLLAQPTGR